jgi:uncharacterized caspase-like protein/tetratricopeptide (TPR) repeat protein
MVMKSIIRVVVSISLAASFFAITPGASRARAQGIQERGLKVKVGATRSEMNSGRAQNVQLWAVLIGVSRYKNGDQNIAGYQIQNLKSAADDAQAIYEFLRSEEGGSFPEDHIILLKDERATKAEVEKALAKLRETKPDDFFITFIAAHGVLAPRFDASIGKTLEVPYFVMHDTDPRDMPNTALPMKAFEDAVRATPAKKGLVLTDTCHSAGVIMAGRGGEATTRANSYLTEELKKNDASGVGYIWAADQTEVSLENSELNLGQGSGHGVFTYCLLEGWRGSADISPPDGLVTYVELKNYVRDKVPQMTDNAQHPGGNTTSIETNDIPVSAVPTTCKNPADCGSVVIRAPEMEGVNVAIDDAPAGTVNGNVAITRRVPSGDRTLSFTVGSMKRQRLARIEPGKSKFIEVNLTFSQSDEDALVPPPESVVNVYFSEEKAPSKEARESFLDGVDAFNRQEMDSAIQRFNDAIRKNNGAYADALVYRGRAEQSLGRKSDAVMSFQQALAIRKSDYETEALLAEARFNLNLDPAEVEPALKSIIRRHPDWDYPRVVLGDVLLFRRDYIGAERELSKAIRINPKSAPAHLILADVLTYQDSKEKRERAVKEAQQALELFNAISKKKVSAARSLKGLSVSHLIFGGGRYRNNTAMAEAHHMVAKTIARKVQFMLYQDDAATPPQAELDLALSAVGAAKELAKNDKTRLALVRETNALIYFLKEDPARAIEEGEAALKMMELPEAHLTLTQAYVSNQRFAQAADHLARYIALSKAQMSPDELKKYQEELGRLTRARDANRQKK